MARARGTSRAASPFPGVTGGPSGASGSPGEARGAEDTRFPPSDPAGAALPALSAAERAYMERKAKEASLALIDHAHTLDGPVQWHYSGKFRGIQMYRGEGSFENAATAGTEFLCGVTTMLGTIEEVAWYFDQRTTDQMRARQPDDVLDAGVLYSLVHGVPSNPLYRVAVKYQSYEGPSRFSRARDYCFLECQDTFRHASGRRGWVLSMHSIKLPSCPELDGIVRGSMYHSGYVFVEAERDGYMDVMHSLQINFKSTSRLPHFLLNAALKRRILSVVKVSREIQMARMGRHALLKRKELMPKKSRSQCLNCSRKFSLFVRKTRCRMCGEVVCQACAPVMEVDVPGRPITKTRICSKCYSSSPTMESSDDFPVADQVENLPSYAQIRRDENETHYSLIRRDENGTHYSFTRADENATNYDGMVAKTALASKANNSGNVSADDDDDLDGDSDDDDGLEEQSSASVFAQSRFTRTSADSIVLPVAPDIDEDDIERYSEVSSAFWKESSVTSTSWKARSTTKPSAANTTFDPKASSASSAFGASHFLTPEDTEEELDKRARRYNPTLSIRDYSREYGRATKTVRASNSSRPSLPPPPPPPYSPTSEDADEDDKFRELDASALRAHNSRPQKQVDGPLMMERKIFGSDDENDKNHANKERRTTKVKMPIDDPNLRDTTGSAILSQVRANRSRTIQFSPEGDFRTPEAMAEIAAEHEKRMKDIRRMQAEKLARESNTAQPTERDPSIASIPSSRPSNKSDSLKHGSASVASRSSSNKPGSPEQRPVSVVSSRSSSRKAGSREQSVASAGSSRSSSAQRQGSDPSSTRDSDGQPAKTVNSGAIAAVTTARPSDSDSERGSGNKSNAATAVGEIGQAKPVVPTNSKLISIRASRTVGSRKTDTFSKEAVRVSVPPSEQLDDLTFDALGSAPEPVVGHESRASEVPHPDVAFMEDTAGRRSTVVLLERISSPRESTMFDEDLINRPTEDLMEQVHMHRNGAVPRVAEEEFRSTEAMLSMEEEHRRRMEELNRIAMDNTGARISRLLDSDADDDDYDELAMSRTRVKRSGTFVLTEDEVERSTEVMENMAAEHQRRMDELNRIAVENVGTRISKFGVDEDEDEDEEPLEVDVDNTSPFLAPRNHERVSIPRSTNEFDQSHLEFVPTISEESTYDVEFASLKQTFGSSSSTEQSERPSSPRESNMSDMSQLDEDLVNRPTEDLMDQVRANRSRKLVNVSSMSSGFQSTKAMRDMERRHKERMAELNKLALDNVGHRISKLDVDDDDEPSRSRDEDMTWRNTDMMEGFQSEHDRKMEALREKLRQLEFECRESIASVLTPEELELEDEAFEADPVVRNSDTSWIGSAKPSKLLRTTRALPPRVHEPVSASTLYEQIAELSKLQQEMALAKTEGDEEEFRARIKEQYRLLRSIKLRGW